MATLYLNAKDFYLKSSWVGTESGGEVRYTTPSLARETVRLAADQLPDGARVTAAVLRVRVSEGYTGGTLTVNGDPALTRDIAALITPDSAGRYPALPLAFAYRANGGAGGAGSHLSTAHVLSVGVTVTYEPDDGAAADMSAAIWQAAAQPGREMAPTAALVFPDGSAQALGAGEIVSFQVDEGCDDGPLLGQAPAASLSIRLANAAHEWYPGGSLRADRELLGAQLRLGLRVTTALGPVNVPLGAFALEEMRGDEGDAYLELRGYDAMANVLEAPWRDNTAYPALLSDLLANIAAQAGLGVDGVLACNRDRTILRRPEWPEDCTLRQGLMHVCAAGGSFACVTRAGRLGIRPARPDSAAPLTLTPAHYMRLRHDERRFRFNRVTAWPKGAADPEDAVTDAVDAAVPARPQNTLSIRKNPLLTGDDEQTRGLLAGLKAAFTGAEWQALALTWRGDPQRVIGEAVALTDQDGRVLRSMIAGQSLCWDRGLYMKAVCRVTYAAT